MKCDGGDDRKVRVSDNKVLINIDRPKPLSFDKRKFVDALKNAMFTGENLGLKKDFDYELLGCKQFKCGDGNSIGIIPIESPYRAQNLDSLDNSSMYMSLQVDRVANDELDFSKIIKIRDRRFLELVDEVLYNYSSYDVFDGVIEYPQNWANHEGCLILNEAFEVGKGLIEDLLGDIVIDDSTQSKGFVTSGKCYKLKKHDIDELHGPCSLCGRIDGEGVSIWQESNRNETRRLPRSTVCLSCLPRFMSKYLGYTYDEVRDNIVLNKF